MKMKAAVVVDYDSPLVVEEVELQEEPKAGEALIKISAVSICHTDLGILQRLYPTPLPVIPGHEGAGIVQAVGPGVTKVKEGDAVVISSVVPCGHCYFCVHGMPFACANALGAFGGTMPDGTKRISKDGQEIAHFFFQSSFAEYAVVPESALIKIPEGVPVEKMAPLGCGVQTGSGAVLNAAKVSAGSSVAVVGCGGVGLSAIMAANAVSAMPIIAVDVVPERLEFAKELGATHAINAAQTNPVDEIMKLTGMGVDYGFEAIGRPDTIRTMVNAVRPRGLAVVIGAPAFNAEVTLDFMSIFMKEIKGTLEGDSISEYFIPTLIRLWQQGRFPFDKLSPKTYTLDQINEAIKDMESGKVVKPLIKF